MVRSLLVRWNELLVYPGWCRDAHRRTRWRHQRRKLLRPLGFGEKFWHLCVELSSNSILSGGGRSVSEEVRHMKKTTARVFPLLALILQTFSEDGQYNSVSVPSPLI